MSQLQKLNAALATRPSDPFLLYAIAMEHLKLSQTKLSLECFEKLTHSHPKYVPTYLQFGMLLADSDQNEKAKEVLKHGIIIARECGDLHAASEMEAAITEID